MFFPDLPKIKKIFSSFTAIVIRDYDSKIRLLVNRYLNNELSNRSVKEAGRLLVRFYFFIILLIAYSFEIYGTVGFN